MEKFTNPFGDPFAPKPEPEGSLPSKEGARKNMELLVQTAKANVEGVFLYAPIPEDTKNFLLEQLANVPNEYNDEMQEAFLESKITQEESAALYVDRRMRTIVQEVASKLGEDGRMLLIAFDSIYTGADEHYRAKIRDWMSKGANKE